MPGPSNNKKKRKGGNGGAGGGGGAKKQQQQAVQANQGQVSPDLEQQRVEGKAAQVQAQAQPQPRTSNKQNKGGKKQKQRTNDVSRAMAMATSTSAATTESVVYVTNTHGEGGDGGAGHGRGVLIEDDYYDDAQHRGRKSHARSRYSRYPSQPLSTQWQYATNEDRYAWRQEGEREVAEFEEVERGRTRYRTGYRPQTESITRNQANANVGNLTGMGLGTSGFYTYAHPGSDHGGINSSSSSIDNGSGEERKLPHSYLRAQSPRMRIGSYDSSPSHSYPHSQQQSQAGMYSYIQSSPASSSTSGSGSTSTSAFVSSSSMSSSSQIFTPSPTYGMDGDEDMPAKKDAPGSMVQVLLPDPQQWESNRGTTAREATNRDNAPKNGLLVDASISSSPMSSLDGDTRRIRYGDYYEDESECSDEECDCRGWRRGGRTRRESGETNLSVYSQVSGADLKSKSSPAVQAEEGGVRSAPSPVPSNDSSYHSAEDASFEVRGREETRKGKQKELPYEAEVRRPVEGSWVHAIEQSLTTAGYDVPTSAPQLASSSSPTLAQGQGRDLDKLKGKDRDREILSRITPFIHDPGNGPRVRDVKAFLKCPYFAQPPALDDPLCAEFAQDEVLEMLLMVLPEEMALILWYNKSRWTSRICPACQRLYRVGDVLPEHMYGDDDKSEEGDEGERERIDDNKSWKSYKAPSPILKKEQTLSGLCSPICFILASFNHPGAIKYAWGNMAHEMDERIWEILNGPGTGTAKSEVAAGLSMLVRMTRLGDLGLGDLFRGMYEAEGEGEGEEDDEGEREYDVDGLGEVDVDGLGEVDVDGYVDELGEVEMGDGEDGGELEGYEDPEEVYEARLEGKMRYIQSEVEDNQHCVASAGASAGASGQSRIPVQRTAKVH